jgi:DNA-binding GntR family transcriptional regulator
MDKQSAYEDIRLQIIEEKLLPGQWLIERELCEAYSLSRTPVREILWKLVADGFLEQESNRGFSVRRLGLEQIFEIYQAREAVEGMAARLACRKGSEAFRGGLQELKKKIMDTNIESSPSEGIALGRQLHNAIMEAARNSVLGEMHKKLNNLVALTSNITKRSAAIEKASGFAHLDIIEAIIEQDEEKSERLMRTHLRETCRQVVDQFYPGMIGESSGR